MENIIMRIILISLGLVIGYKNKTILIYSFLITSPFNHLGNFKYITIGTNQIGTYFCILPLIIFYGIEIIFRRKKLEPIQRYFGLSLIIFYSYILYQYILSIHPDKDNLFIVLSLGFVLLLTTIYYYDSMNLNVVVRIFELIVIVEFVTVIMQLLNMDISKLFFMFDFSDINLKNISYMGTVRGTGTFYDPNYFALYLSVLSAILIGRKGIINSAILLISLVTITCTFSRMGIILVAILVVAVFHSALKDKRRNSNTKISLIFFSVAILILAALLLPNIYIQAITQRFSTNEDFYAGGRFFILATYFKDILSVSNFFTGLGLENFQFALYSKSSIELAAHNEYVQIMGDFGIIGILLVSLIAFIVIRYKKLINITGNPFKFPVIMILIGNLFLTTTFELYLYFFIAGYIGFIFNHKNTVEVDH